MSKSARNKLGKNIRNLRHEKGWSQEELADKVGLHRTYVGAVERGEQNITVDTLAKLAKALGASFEALFQGM